MARDFSKNLSNYVSNSGTKIGSLLNGASAVSVAAWANADTLTTGASDNQIVALTIGSGFASVTLSVQGNTTPKVLRAGGRSRSDDGFQSRVATTEFTTGTWHHCGGILDISGDTITPYFNGVSEGSGAVSFAATTYTHTSSSGVDVIGGNPGTSGPTATQFQFDGRIAEIAFWAGNIGAASFAALAKGASPLIIRPDILVAHFPLIGYQSPEYDCVGGLTGTITGTISKSAHPRIIHPRRSRMIYIPTSTPPSGNRRRRVLLCGRGY